jgi:hypothetical protein
MKFRIVLFFCSLLLSISIAAQPNMPSLDQLGEGWNSIPTDGLCSSGTPFQFYVDDSSVSDKLLIYFNGGGGCWFGEACDLNSEPNIHTAFADMYSNDPSNFHGIFAEDVDNNSFNDYDKVVVPYCTGDSHLGAGEKFYTYTDAEGGEVTINTYHNGYANSTIVLNWIYENYPTPDNIVISGSSAGAIGSSFYSGTVAAHYENTQVVLIADAAGGYNSPDMPALFNAWNVVDILPDWPEYAGKTNDNLNFEDFYIASANHNPNLTIAQYNTAEDALQKTFSYLLGDTPGGFSLPQRIFNHYVEIESAVDNFHSYTAGGNVHIILNTPDYYSYRVEGVSFADWVTGLVNGDKVADISCVNEVKGCDLAPGSD